MFRIRAFVTALIIVISSSFASRLPIRATDGLQESPCQTMFEVRSIAFSPDSNYIAAAGHSNFVTIWEVESGKKLRQLHYKDGNYMVYYVAYAPNGKYIAASTDEDAALWDVETGKLLYIFKGDAKDFTLYGLRITFTPDSNNLLVSDTEGSILWSVHTGKKTRTFSYHVGSDVYIPEELSPDGKYLLTNGDDLLLWEMNTGKVISKLGMEDVYLTPDASFLPDGKTILIHPSHIEEYGLAVLNVWSIEQQKIIQTMNPVDAGLIWDFSPNGKYVAYTIGVSPGYPGGLLEIWGLQNYKRIFRLLFTDPHQGFVAFLPDNDRFILGPNNTDSDTSIPYDIWSLKTARIKQHVVINEVDDGYILSTALSPNNKYIAVVVGNGSVVLELRDGKTFEVIREYCGS